MKNKITLIIFILIILSLFFVFYKKDNSNGNLNLNNNFISIKIKDTKVNAEIADTISEQRFGLSGKISIPSNAGMLFVFGKDDFHGIWMKDMLFPIDIIWLDKNLTVVDIENNVSPNTYPKIFKPISRSSYVLEVNAGFAEKHDIKIGENFSFDK